MRHAIERCQRQVNQQQFRLRLELDLHGTHSRQANVARQRLSAMRDELDQLKREQARREGRVLLDSAA